MNFRLLFAAMFLVSCASWQPLGSYELQSQRNFDRDFYECVCEATVDGADNQQQVGCTPALRTSPSLRLATRRERPLALRDKASTVIWLSRRVFEKRQAI